ncbi:MAG: APC family permease [Gemmatimonadaceae bacterium]|nr:APC family permease [Gemmatimonadaceae bacterium]
MSAPPTPHLSRQLTLLPLAATGICSMVGASINVVPIMIQRSVPGIGPWVLPAFAFAAVPALLAALAYAALASAMPRAGGSYLYASRALSPYLGFVASFSQWFGLSIAIGVVSYVIPPFLRDIATALDWTSVATALDHGPIRLVVALLFLWTFVLVNLRGLGAYERTIVPLMIAMFALGAIVIVAGAQFTHADFAAAAERIDGRAIAPAPAAPFDLRTFLTASAVLFSSFIGFDAIAQAGGEAKHPTRDLPRAIGLAVVIVAAFYFAFASAVYHAVPWNYIAAESATRDLTAPGLLGYLLSPTWTVLIVSGAAIALTNDLPSMILSVSRLMFAWAADGIFPASVAEVHPTRHTPTRAILVSAGVSSLGIIGSHLAGDFFLGVDLLVVSMLVNFLLMCMSVITIQRRNPTLASAITVLPDVALRDTLAFAGVVALSLFLLVHLQADFSGPPRAWYFRSTPVWLIVMAVGTLIYRREMAQLRARGVDIEYRFSTLPAE